MMTEPLTCDGCPTALRGAFDTEQKQWCDDCRAIYTPDDAIPMVRAIRSMCADLVELRKFLDRTERRVELVDGGTRAIDYAGLRIVGTGCRGTKGVGSKRGATDVADAIYDAQRVLDGEVPPYAIDRMAEVAGSDVHATLVFLRDYARGDQLYRLTIEKRDIENITLPQWVGLHMEAPETRARWQVKLATGDGSPALVGANRLGNRLLARAARVWWGMP
jgi:hypothetical protein